LEPLPRCMIGHVYMPENGHVIYDGQRQGSDRSLLGRCGPSLSMVASVISGRYTAPILGFSKHVFNLIPLFIHDFIIVYLAFSALPRRGAGRNTLFHRTVTNGV